MCCSVSVWCGLAFSFLSFSFCISFLPYLTSFVSYFYLKRMVELAIEDRVIPKEMYNESAVKSFIEKQLLPAINTQAIDKAHNMFYALQSIYQVK